MERLKESPFFMVFWGISAVDGADAIDQQIVRLWRKVLNSSQHGTAGGLQNVDPVNFCRRYDTDTNRQRLRHDDLKEFLALVRSEFF